MIDNESSAKDRRQFPRSESEFPVIFNLALPVPVNMDFGSDEYPAVALDVSEGGIGLDVDRPIPAGAIVKLHFELINHGAEDEQMRQRSFRVDGEVRHCSALKKKHHHVGVRFLELNPEERSFIASYITGLKLRS